MNNNHVERVIDGHKLSGPSDLMPAEPVKKAHTALPWRDYGCQILNDNGDIVADVRLAGEVEFIGTACNAHDDLVKALQAMHKLLDRNLTFLDRVVCFPFESHDQGWNHVHEARSIVKAALTKAGVK